MATHTSFGQTSVAFSLLVDTPPASCFLLDFPMFLCDAALFFEVSSLELELGSGAAW